MKTSITIKFILLLIMALLVATDQLLYGQAKAELSDGLQDFYCSGRLEIIGGPNIGWKSKSSDDEGKVKPLPGFGLGGQVSTKISEKVGFKPGLYWEMKRSKYAVDYNTDFYTPGMGERVPETSNGRLAFTGPPQTMIFDVQGENSIDEKNTLHYLSIPLVFSFYVLPAMEQFAFLAGLNPGFLVGSKAKVDAFGNEETIKGKDDLYLKTFDLAIMVGVQYMIMEHLGLALIYDHSLTPHYNENDYKYANRVIKLMVIYRLNFNPFFKESYGPQRKDLQFK